MGIKIYDSINKQWLEPIAVYFGKDNSIWKITACKIGEDPISDGWFDFHGNDLDFISIIGEIKFNKHLLPFTEIEIDLIIKIVCEYFKTKPDIVFSKSRKREFVQIRQIMMYLCCEYHCGSNAIIGKNIADKDHSTVTHGHKTISNLIETDKFIAKQVKELNNKLISLKC